MGVRDTASYKGVGWLRHYLEELLVREKPDGVYWGIRVFESVDYRGRLDYQRTWIMSREEVEGIVEALTEVMEKDHGE